MSDIDALHTMLNNINVTDEMISRGVRMTKVGMQKLMNRFGVDAEGLKQMLSDLRTQVAQELTEDVGKRFEYEKDISGSVMLRDTKTGASRFISGSEAFKLLSEIEIGGDPQILIAPFFSTELTESDSFDSEIGNSGGTYNFPFRGNFATARFWMKGAEPKIEVISLVDQNGDEKPLDNVTKAEAEKEAFNWIDRV